MALPTQISTVLMTGTLVDDTGEPLRGSIVLTPSLPQIVSATTDRVIELLPRFIQLDEYGQFSTRMIPSDEADVQPHGIEWSLTLPNDSSPSLSFNVPSDVTTGDISQYVVSLSHEGEAQYLIGYRGPKGDKGDKGDVGPAGYNDTAIQARVAALETSGYVRRLIHNGTAYPTRPAGVTAGYVEYVGPSQPTDWLTGDTWVEQI